jgi:OOP family OmpA-OmpF porin
MIILAKDRMGNFMAGVTGQIKLSERVALTADFTTIPCTITVLMAQLYCRGANSGAQEVLWSNIQWYCGITVYLGKMKSTLTG